MSKSVLGRLLIVDDEPELLSALCETASAQGYEVTGHSSGAEALASLQEMNFDLMLSDLMMPGMDGLTLARSALALDPHLVIIIMTGQGTVPTAVEAMKLGAFDYLLKPFKMSALLPALERGLAVRRLRLENLQLRETLAIYELCQAVTLTLDPATILNKIADAALQQTEADELSILLPTADGKEFHVAVLRGERAELHAGDRVPLDRGVIGWVATHKEPLLLDGPVKDERFAPLKPRPEICSAISQPMLVGNRLVGVLNVNVTRRRRPFTLGQIKALSILTGLGAAALEAASLHDRVREEALMLDLASDAILACAPTDKIIYWNRGAERLYGWSATEAVGKDPRQLLFREPAPATADVDRGLAERGDWHGELRQTTRDGKDVVVFSRKTLVRDGKGRPRSKLIINTDITAKKQLEAQYLHAQRMESIGTLAGGVAHDFNNLLTVITGYSELLLARSQTEDPAYELLRVIRGAGERAAGLTRQLLAFSRKQVMATQVVDLNAIVQELSKMLRRFIGEDIDLAASLDSSLGRVEVDPGQIEQVLMNLVVNARDAMPTGGQLTIETKNVDLDEPYVRRCPEVRPGAFVVLTLSDTGHGMDEATRARIFEPFFTTKEVGKGTGLGLATVYGIVKQSRGHIEVYSEVGRGTTFKLYLPRVEGTVAPLRRSAQGTRKTAQPEETILLAEDEAEVRGLIGLCLQAAGYTVLEAVNGQDAIQIMERHSGPIHLLMTDVVMPVMSGRQLAERVTQVFPDVKVLYLSGYTDDAVVRHGILGAGMPFLQKPFTPSALADKVREVLDTKKS